MKIWHNKLSGSVDIINGLNHYIGMAEIDESMFPELKILGYIVAAFIALGLATFIVNREFMLRIFTAAILVFAVAALVDMYIWGYKYGHNLDSHAAIKIEGESYQPPLVGYKQLLNFLALSAPDNGGIAMMASGTLLLLASLTQWFRNRRIKAGAAIAAGVLLCSLTSCGTKEVVLDYNLDACDHCSMKLVDNRYGALIITKKGKAFRFDDINCMLNFRKEKMQDAEIETIKTTDYSNPGRLIDATTALYLNNDNLKSPMGANTAAFFVEDSLERYTSLLGGSQLRWAGIQHIQ